MGIYETVLGTAYIPSILVILAILANGTGRRMLYKFLLPVLGVEIKINGYHFKIINFLTFTNIAYTLACLSKISRLHSLHSMEHGESQHHHNMDPFHKGEYIKELYIAYRNMIMNICSVILTVCLTVATTQYGYYKDVKDQSERLVKKN
jgi:hypothetical protein